MKFCNRKKFPSNSNLRPLVIVGVSDMEIPTPMFIFIALQVTFYLTFFYVTLPTQRRNAMTSQCITKDEKDADWLRDFQDVKQHDGTLTAETQVKGELDSMINADSQSGAENGYLGFF